MLPVAPYFKVRDEEALTRVASPAGRTVKLTCKAGGKPEPQVHATHEHLPINHDLQVIWSKDGIVIHSETKRPLGSKYGIRKWTLELEDASTSDSGKYVCEV